MFFYRFRRRAILEQFKIKNFYSHEKEVLAYLAKVLSKPVKESALLNFLFHLL
jgi:hypothetical protein